MFPRHAPPAAHAAGAEQRATHRDAVVGVGGALEDDALDRATAQEGGDRVVEGQSRAILLFPVASSI